MNMPSQPLTRRAVLRMATSAVGIAALSGCRTRSSREEVILTEGGSFWGRAQHEAFYRPFEQATGIRVRTVPFVMAGKLRTSIEQGRPLLDVADMSGADVPAFVRDGLLAPIDKRALNPADLAALVPLPAQECAVPSFYASTVLAYRRELFPEREPEGWAAVWDVAHRPGPRMLASGALGQMGATFEIALLADGVSLEKLYPLDWDRAIRSLTRLRASIAKFWLSSGEALQLLNEGEASAGNIWNGPIDRPEAQNMGSLFTWNQGILQAGYWAIPHGAPHAENALRFLTFALRPEQQAHFARLIGYSPSNSAALRLLTPQRATHMPTASANLHRQVIQNYDWWASEEQPGVTNLAHAVRLWESWVAQ
jgi:putative spermidine/putrescine transport system substrate-binding protein